MVRILSHVRRARMLRRRTIILNIIICSCGCRSPVRPVLLHVLSTRLRGVKRLVNLPRIIHSRVLKSIACPLRPRSIFFNLMLTPAVVIKPGIARISPTAKTTCLLRYPCSWVSVKQCTSLVPLRSKPSMTRRTATADRPLTLTLRSRVNCCWRLRPKTLVPATPNLLPI